jgi:hypothetical protein
MTHRINACYDWLKADAAARCPFKPGDRVRYTNRQPALMQTFGTVTHIITAGTVYVQWGIGGHGAEIDVEKLEAAPRGAEGDTQCIPTR